MSKASLGKFKRRFYNTRLNKTDTEYFDTICYLLDTAGDYTVDERNQIVQELTDDYFTIMGNEMKPQFLEALGDFLLSDILADRSTNKVTKDAYPILSERQIIRRNKREFIMEADTMDYFEHEEKWGLGAKTKHEKADY